MKKLFYVLAVAAGMICTACDHYDHAITDQNDRLDVLEQSTIKNIDDQVKSINSSLAYLEEVDTAVETLIDSLNASDSKNEELIAKLSMKDTELDQQIADLKKYLDEELSKSKDWANSTFATLEQYADMQKEIATLSSLLAQYKNDFSADITDEVENAVKELETSMKNWVNDFLAEGYYNIAAIDEKLLDLETRLTSEDGVLASKIDEQKKALERAETALTAAYKDAIRTAINEYDGGLQPVITAIKDAQDDLKEKVGNIEEELIDIKERLGIVEEMVENLVARIQSIRFVPEYNDGKVELVQDGTTDLTFILSPKETAAALATAFDAKNEVISAYISRTKVHTRAIDTPTALQVEAVSGDPATGLLVVSLNSEELPDDFWKYVQDANIYICISDGNNDIISEMIPICTIEILDTEEEFAEALAEGSVKLETDLYLTSPFIVGQGQEVTIDLNDCIIYNEATMRRSISNFDMFTIDGGTLTVMNGTICTTNDALSSIFNITNGGVLNLVDVTVQNLGAAEHASCVTVDDSSASTLNVNASNLKSTFVAVSLLNVSPDGNNIDIQGSTLTGEFCLWVQNLEAENLTDVFDFLNADNGFESTGKAPILKGDEENPDFFDEVGAELIFNAAGLTAALQAGGDYALANDIFLSAPIQISDKTFSLDGRGYKIGQSSEYPAEGTATTALIHPIKCTANIQNVVFDGLNVDGPLRTVSTKLTISNVTVVNCRREVTGSTAQGLFRLHGESSILKCTFRDNICPIAISLNWDGSNNLPQSVTDCVFENNTCISTGVLYYVKGSMCEVDGNTFIGNNVNVSGGNNAATVYMGFTENNIITNNLFLNNTVTVGTSKRVAGGLMIGYDAVIRGNAFVGNTVSGTNAKGNDVCASVYYTSIDLSGNYWGGSNPTVCDNLQNAESDNYDIFQEYTNNNVIINDYLTEYPGL